VASQINLFTIQDLSYLSLAKNILSKETIGLIVEKALTYEKVEEPELVRLAIASSKFKLDGAVSYQSMKDTFERSNIVEILDDKLISKPNVFTVKNEIICSGRLKGNLVVTYKQ
jgi:hypothetical protein